MGRHFCIRGSKQRNGTPQANKVIIFNYFFHYADVNAAQPVIPGLLTVAAALQA